MAIATRAQITALQERIRQCRAKRTETGKLEARLIALVLQQLRKEIREDRKREKIAS